MSNTNMPLNKIPVLVKFLGPGTLLELPEENNSYYHYYNDRTEYTLHSSLYFCFGSNLAGRHGKGAAQTAWLNYGAIYNLPEGFQGRSYAVPTKDAFLRVLSLAEISIYVERFKKVSVESGKHFFVTAVGTGYAGYKHSDIAPLFKGVKNCWLPHEWRSYIEGTTNGS